MARVDSLVNRYEYSRLLGIALLVLGAGALALVYPPSPALGAQAVLLVVAGGFHILSGTPSALRERVGPHRLLGAGNVLLGASLAVSGLGDVAGGTDGDVVYAAAVLLGGLSLVGVGLAYIVRPSAFGLGPDGFPEQ